MDIEMPDEATTGERELVQGLKDSQDWAFEELNSRYRNKMLGFAKLFLGPHAMEAEDLVQEVFVKVSKSIVGFKEDSSLSTWMYAILKNACIDRAKHLKIKHSHENSVVTFNNPRKTDSRAGVQKHIRSQKNYLSGLDRKELNKLLLEKLGQLPEKARSLLILRHFEGYSSADAAKALKLKEGTARGKEFNARRKLKEIISGDKRFELYLQQCC